MLKNKKLKTMEEVSKGYEAFIKGKETNKNNRKLFDAVIKKAAKSKPHGSK